MIILENKFLFQFYIFSAVTVSNTDIIQQDGPLRIYDLKPVRKRIFIAYRRSDVERDGEVVVVVGGD